MKFYHSIGNINAKPGYGGLTIGYRLNENKVSFTVAQCSNRDRYNKQIGRDIVTQRFLKGEVLTMSIKGNRKNAERLFLSELPYLIKSLKAFRSPF